MKHVITTIILLVVAVVVTTIYFKNINKPGSSPAEVVQQIPGDALFVAEFNNDESFYSAFSGNTLFTSVLGASKTTELVVLKQKLLSQPLLKSFLATQPIFVSLQPADSLQTDLLITTAANKTLKGNLTDMVSKLYTAGAKAEVIKPGARKFIKITLTGVARAFFIVQMDNNILHGSFSLPLLTKAINHQFTNEAKFVKVPDQQYANALSILYLNYNALTPVLRQFFISAHPELLKPLQMLAARSALSLNYKTDALMYNGTTQTEPARPQSFINLFLDQKPVENQLPDIYPSTTAYSTTYGVSDAQKFNHNLEMWNGKSGLQKNEELLFNQVKAETGVNIKSEWRKQLGKEFGLVITRFQERLAIIEIKNGQQLLPSLVNISQMDTEHIGRFKYAKLPFYLLGDTFGLFNQPYFTVINNYLVLANSAAELRAYTDSYDNQKFLSKISDYNEFNSLMADRSNVSFFINFKNSRQVFKRDLKPDFYNAYENEEPGFKNFYGASYQLSAAGKDFYTNLCLKLNSTATAPANQ